MTLKVLKDLCIGCATCVALAPETFKMDDDGKAIVYNDKGNDEETILMTKDACPVKAIV